MQLINNIITGAAFTAMLLAIAELCKQNKHAIEYLSSGLYFVFGCGLIVDQINHSTLFYSFPHFAYVNDFLEILGAVLLYFYLRSFFEKNVRINKKERLFFVPAVVVLLLYLPFYVQNAQFKLEHYPISNIQSFFMADIYRFINGYAEIWILLFIMIFLIRLYILKTNKSSNLKHFSSLQIKVIILYCLAWILIATLFIYNNFHPNQVLQRFIMLIWSLLGCGLLCIRFFFDSLSAAESKILREPHLTLKISDTEKKRIIQKIEMLMTDEKLYQDPDLKLADVSSRLKCSQHFLSELLNMELHASFATYINGYRIKAAQDLLKNNKSMDILSIAFECGFNSKTAFNTNFKKCCGITPSEYRGINTT